MVKIQIAIRSYWPLQVINTSDQDIATHLKLIIELITYLKSQEFATFCEQVNFVVDTLRNVIMLVLLIIGIVLVYQWSSAGLSLLAKYFM